MSAPPSTVACTLSIAGRGFDPEALARELAIPGATPWRPRQTGRPHPENLPTVAVDVGVGPAPYESLDAAAREVLARVMPAGDRLVAAAARLGADVALVFAVKVYTERPLYVLSPDTVRAAAALGAEVSLDLVDLRA